MFCTTDGQSMELTPRMVVLALTPKRSDNSSNF